VTLFPRYRCTGAKLAFALVLVDCGGAAPPATAPVAPPAAAPVQSPILAGTPPGRVAVALPQEKFPTQPGDDDEEDADPPTGEAKTVFKIPVGKSPMRGGPAALVTIVEFADYQCPYCSVVESTLRELRRDYGDKLRIVVKEEPLPFHPRAEPAAEAALEVRAEKGDAAFWTMHDLLFDNQRDLSDDVLVRLAASAGARGNEVRAAIRKRAHRAEIEADEEVADDFQAGGTPHFFINGRRLVGAQPKDNFVAIVDDELKRAKALLDAGTRPEALYDALTSGGAGPPEPERKGLDSLPKGDPARGPTTAKVTVHEFADFQCPFCARAEATLQEVAKSYGDRVRFVWHDLPLPFHDRALAAARGAREGRRQGGDRAFWALHDKFLLEAKLSRGDLDAAARSLGLDMDKWKAALDGEGHDAEIGADRDAASALGFKGTPSFLIVPLGAMAGYVITGAQGYPKFRKLIERASIEARQ
jgi:protein-disulfide isomerase